jgi:GH25 family lysozyme M1 (1,4-beta-N-acetylmuramidase)
MSKPKRPRDTNLLAKKIVDISTGESEIEINAHKNKAAVELGRLGGLKGGKARAAKMTKKQRSEAARKAANARWKNRKSDSGA